MRIGLIDVDGHHFPNLALMRISAWHKAAGDQVEWWWSDFIHYDIVYKSKVFSDAYSNDVSDPMNADKVLKGGTGYCIYLGEDGMEHFDASKNFNLPDEVEAMFPDYSIYPEHSFAISMTSRGCPRGCTFCHVAAKDGRRSHQVAEVKDFWNGQGEIVVLDPNITACPNKHELFDQYRRTGALIDFSQGLDIRLLTEKDIDDVNQLRLKELHWAWDNPEEDLEDLFRYFKKRFRRSSHPGMVYCLTNFGSTMEQNLHRIYTLRDLGYDPFVMIYDKPNAPQEIKDLQRWCNNKFVFKKTPRFEDYVPTRDQ